MLFSNSQQGPFERCVTLALGYGCWAQKGVKHVPKILVHVANGSLEQVSENLVDVETMCFDLLFPHEETR